MGKGVIKGTYLIDEVKSKVHRKVLKFLAANYPNWLIQREKEIKIEGHNLYADIYITSPHKIVVEIMGIQHYQHVPFFHKTANEFEHQKYLDELKKRWCDINGFAYLAINAEEYDEAVIGRDIKKAIMDFITKDDE